MTLNSLAPPSISSGKRRTNLNSQASLCLSLSVSITAVRGSRLPTLSASKSHINFTFAPTINLDQSGKRILSNISADTEWWQHKVHFSKQALYFTPDANLTFRNERHCLYPCRVNFLLREKIWRRCYYQVGKSNCLTWMVG